MFSYTDSFRNKNLYNYQLIKEELRKLHEDITILFQIFLDPDSNLDGETRSSFNKLFIKHQKNLPPNDLSYWGIYKDDLLELEFNLTNFFDKNPCISRDQFREKMICIYDQKARLYKKLADQTPSHDSKDYYLQQRKHALINMKEAALKGLAPHLNATDDSDLELKRRTLCFNEFTTNDLRIEMNKVSMLQQRVASAKPTERLRHEDFIKIFAFYETHNSLYQQLIECVDPQEKRDFDLQVIEALKNNEAAAVNLLQDKLKQKKHLILVGKSKDPTFLTAKETNELNKKMHELLTLQATYFEQLSKITFNVPKKNYLLEQKKKAELSLAALKFNHVTPEEIDIQNAFLEKMKELLILREDYVIKKQATKMFSCSNKEKNYGKQHKEDSAIQLGKTAEQSRHCVVS